MTATARYEIKGTTGDVTECAFGHTGLKKTVIVAVLDADGNPEDVIYLGTDCAAKVMATSEKRVRDAAAAEDGKLRSQIPTAEEWIATYGPVEGDRRATAELFFSRNPHMRTKCKASDEVASLLAWARDVLARAAALPAKTA